MAEDVPIGVGDGVAVGNGDNVGVGDEVGIALGVGEGIKVGVGVGTQCLVLPLHLYAETFEELINNKIAIAIMPNAVIKKIFPNLFLLFSCCIKTL